MKKPNEEFLIDELIYGLRNCIKRPLDHTRTNCIWFISGGDHSVCNFRRESRVYLSHLFRTVLRKLYPHNSRTIPRSLNML